MAQVSEAKLAANRANALKSTGPRTAEGKLASSVNALKHGFRSEVLRAGPGEFNDDIAEFTRELCGEFRPAGAMQRLLFERIVHLSWKLRRLMLAEAELMEELAVKRYLNRQSEFKFAAKECPELPRTSVLDITTAEALSDYFREHGYERDQSV